MDTDDIAKLRSWILLTAYRYIDIVPGVDKLDLGGFNWYAEHLDWPPLGALYQIKINEIPR